MGCSRLWQFLRFIVFKMTLRVLKSTAQEFCGMTLDLDLSTFSLMIRISKLFSNVIGTISTLTGLCENSCFPTSYPTFGIVKL